MYLSRYSAKSKSANVPTIRDFRKKYFFLSNYYMCPVEYEGIVYPSSEHAFQAAKSLDGTIRQKIANVKKPGDAKKLGNDKSFVVLRPQWEDIKDTVMYQILKAKFTQNQKIRKNLLATGAAPLVEGNWWHDNYWGVCWCSRCKKNIQGKNNLGQQLMRIREFLREEAKNQNETRNS